jgi:two-component system sensor histidine kinase/response regulator
MAYRFLSIRTLPRGLRPRLLCSIGVLLAALVCGLSWYQAEQAVKQEMQWQQAELLAIARSYAEIVPADLSAAGPIPLHHLDSALRIPGVVAIQFVNGEGRIVDQASASSTPTGLAQQLAETHTLASPQPTSHVEYERTSGLLGIGYSQRAKLIEARQPAGTGWLLVWRLPRQGEQIRQHAFFNAMASGTFFLCVCILGCVLIIRRPLRDLTAQVAGRERAECATQDAIAFLNGVVNAIPHPLFVKDREGRLVLVNVAWLELTGASAQTVFGNVQDDALRKRIDLNSSWVDVDFASHGTVARHATLLDTHCVARRVIEHFNRFSTGADAQFVVGLFCDITKIIRAKEDIETQLRFARELVEASPLPLYVKDLKGRYILFNGAAEKFFGLRREDVLGKRVDDLQPDSVAQQHRSTDSRVAQNGSALTYIAPFVNSSRNLQDVLWTKAAFTNPDGKIAGIIETASDITERKRIERRLHLQYETARTLTDAASVTDACDRMMQTIATELNYTEGTFWEVDLQHDCLERKQTWSAIDHGALIPSTSSVRAKRGVGLPGQVWGTGIPQRGKDAPSDTGLHQLGSGFAFPAKVGNKILGVMHFFGGRTEEADGDLLAMLEATGNQLGQFMQHQRVQQNLRASEAAARKLSLVASHTLNAVVITDTKGRIDWVNNGFTTMTGYTLDEASGRRLDELLHGVETDRSTSDHMNQRMDEHQAFMAELINYRKSGEKYWVSIEIQPVFSDEYELTNFIAIETDITERQLGEAALVESNIRLNLALEGGTLALWDWHIPSNTVYLSEMWSVMLGGPRRETVTNLAELARGVPKEEALELRAKVAATLKGETLLYDAVHRVRGENGEWRWIHSHGKVVERDSDGRAVRLSGINADVTDRHYQELALRDSEERYDVAVNGSNDGIWDLNLAEQTLYMSPRFAELFAIGQAEAGDVLERWHSLFHPQDQLLEQQALHEHLQSNLPFDAEYRMTVLGGQFRWFRVRGKALYGADLKPYRIAGSVTDTTDYRLARDQLEEMRDRLDSILRSAEHMIWSRSTDLTTLIYINPAVRTIYQCEPDAFYANPACWFEAVHGEDKTRVAEAMSTILDEGSVEMEFRILRKDGTIAWINDRVSVARNALGEAIRVDAITSDITELKSREIELRSAKETAEAATRAKSEFLANMSHEIRTPMNGIIGIADLVLTGKLSAEQREYIEMVRSSANALLELINDILDFSKIEAGMLHFERSEFVLRETLTDSMKLLAVRAEEKGLELIWRADAAVPDLLVGDPLRLRQVVTNMVSNAVKFTKHGEVELCVGLEESTANRIKLLFAVRDTGIGIPQHQIESVFQPFSQADMSTTRKYGGSGLGLAICDRLVKLMGGSMSVRSTPELGSTFYFSAWFELASDNAVHPDNLRIEVSKSKVLVCDDNPSQLISLVEMFSAWQMEFASADNLNQALGMLEAACEAGKPFDVAVLDASLAGAQERTLVQKIRARSALQDLPLVLLTPVSQKRGRGGDRASQAQKLSRIAKPWSHAELKEAIAIALGRAEPRKAQRKSAPKPGRKLRLLLAEDNEINIRFALGVLEKLGHEVTVARTGLEALQAVGASDTFDLVLMDVQMPIMSGLEATGAIRALERGTQRHLPIIAMTANAMRGDREVCLESGMDDYVSKPVTVAKLMEAIGRIIPTGSRRALQNAKTKISESKKISERLQNGGHASLPYDRDSILDVLSHDHDAFRELSQMLFVDHKQMLEDAEQALAAADLTKLTSIAHTFKGMVGNFAAQEASIAAQAFYEAAEKGLAEEAIQTLERFKMKLVVLTEALKRDPIFAPE